MKSLSATILCMDAALGLDRMGVRQSRDRKTGRSLMQHINNCADDAEQYRLRYVEILLELQSKQHKKVFTELCCTATL